METVMKIKFKNDHIKKILRPYIIFHVIIILKYNF